MLWFVLVTALLNLGFGYLLAIQLGHHRQNTPLSWDKLADSVADIAQRMPRKGRSEESDLEEIPETQNANSPSDVSSSTETASNDSIASSPTDASSENGEEQSVPKEAEATVG